MDKTESEEGKIKVMQNYFSKTENFQMGLSVRMDNFLNNLLYSSIQAVNQT
jgi:hypothetical protein